MRFIGIKGSGTGNIYAGERLCRIKSTKFISICKSSTRNQLQGFVCQVNILRKVQLRQSFQILDVLHSSIGDEPTTDLKRLKILKTCRSVT